MLNTVKYILQNGLDSLSNEFGIKIKNYPDEGIAILNYSMIDSPKYHPIVRECRSLIIENKYPYNIVSRSFDRFYNYSECPDTNKFNFKDAVILDKIDGSLINVYYFNGKWHISTKGTAFGEAETVTGIKYRDLVLSVFDIDIYKDILYPFNVDIKDLTFIFEVVSPHNRIVTPYKKTDLYLIGVRNKKTGIEFVYDHLQLWAETLDVKVPEIFNFNDYNLLVDRFREVSAFTEGYVCVDYNNNHRLKIKNPAYVNIHHIRDNGTLSSNRIVGLVWDGEEEEYLAYFPEDREFFAPYINAMEKLVVDIEDIYNKYKNIESQKEFALTIKDLSYKSLLFQLRAGRSIDDVLLNVSKNFKINILTTLLEDK